MGAPHLRFEPCGDERGLNAFVADERVGEVWRRHGRQDWGWRLSIGGPKVVWSEGGHVGTRNLAKRKIRDAWRAWWSRYGDR